MINGSECSENGIVEARKAVCDSDEQGTCTDQAQDQRGGSTEEMQLRALRVTEAGPSKQDGGVWTDPR
ncbi:hypothetical protein ACQP3L_39720, partial [Escherichia coli]